MVLRLAWTWNECRSPSGRRLSPRWSMRRGAQSLAGRARLGSGSAYFHDERFGVSAKLVIFDLDGTLIDSRPGIASSLEETARELGLGAVDPRQVACFIGPPLRQGLKEIFGLHAHEVDRAVEVFRNSYSTSGIFDAITYPGVAACLSALAATATLAVATSKPEPYARRLLQEQGLIDFFSSVRGATLDGTLSAKSAIIASVLDELDLQPSETIMVGDRDQDIRGAKACAVVPIGVAWGFGSVTELLDAGAVAVVAQPVELLELVESER
jgi:phosphoglycolate phosphatase